MSTAPYYIIAAPAQVFIHLTPGYNDLPSPTDAVSTFSANWLPLGYTDGGIEISHTETSNPLMVDQLSVPVKYIRPEEGISIKFSLANINLFNYAIAGANGNSVAVSGGISTLNLYKGVSIARYAMLILCDGPYVAAGDADRGNMQFEFPAVQSAGQPKINFVRDDKAVLETEWNVVAALTTDSGTPAITEAANNKFGRIRAQSS